MPFLIAYWKPIVLILALGALLIGGSFWWSNTKARWIKTGYDQAMAEVKIAQEEANQKLRQRKKVVKNETSFDRAAIIAELCSRNELRTPEYCAK